MADVSWIDKAVAKVCTVADEPCLRSHDVITTGIGGLVAGAVAVWVYTWRKNGEYADRRSDIARIQANEIVNNMGVLQVWERGQRKTTAARTPPWKSTKGCCRRAT